MVDVNTLAMDYLGNLAAIKVWAAEVAKRALRGPERLIGQGLAGYADDLAPNIPAAHSFGLRATICCIWGHHTSLHCVSIHAYLKIGHPSGFNGIPRT